MNVISEVSYNQIRLVVMGYSVARASAAELARMKELALRSMREGAWGLGSGHRWVRASRWCGICGRPSARSLSGSRPACQPGSDVRLAPHRSGTDPTS